MKKTRICGIDAEVAETFAERARGLIGRRTLADGKGMLILRCNAIHTFFMRFAIDAYFLDADDRIVKTVKNIRPWRPLVWGGFLARKVLEVKAGSGERGMVTANASKIPPPRSP